MEQVLVEARVDAEVQRKAAEVLAAQGISVSELLNELLTRTAQEGHLPFELAEPEGYDAWFRAKVQEALDDPRSGTPHEEVLAYMDRRREARLATPAR